MSGKKTKSERPPKEKLTTTDSGGPKVVTNFKEQVCYRCKQPGHTAAECLSKKDQASSTEAKNGQEDSQVGSDQSPSISSSKTNSRSQSPTMHSKFNQVTSESTRKTNGQQTPSNDQTPQDESYLNNAPVYHHTNGNNSRSRPRQTYQIRQQFANQSSTYNVAPSNESQVFQQEEETNQQEVQYYQNEGPDNTYMNQGRQGPSGFTPTYYNYQPFPGYHPYFEYPYPTYVMPYAPQFVPPPPPTSRGVTRGHPPVFYPYPMPFTGRFPSAIPVGYQPEQQPLSPREYSNYRQSPQIVDIGVNLTHPYFKPIMDKVLGRAFSRGIRPMIVTGTSVRGSEDALELCHRYSGLYCTAGVHPHEASTCDDNTISILERLSSDPKVVAIGECGLDFNRNLSPPDVQEKWFREQVKLAVKLKKALFLHERDAHSAFLNILSEFGSQLPPIVVHCFTGTEKEIREYIQLGFYIGFTGFICNKGRGEHLRIILQKGIVPMDKIMIETDSPFMMPILSERTNKRNEPANLTYVLETLAECLGESREKIAQITTENAFKFFALPTE